MTPFKLAATPVLALALSLAGGCGPEASLPPGTGTGTAETGTAGSQTETSSTASQQDSSSDSGPQVTTGADDTTGTGTTTDASESTSALPVTCEETQQSQCRSPVPCLAMPPDPDSCGGNSLFDRNGCPRARCNSREDCSADEACIDLVPCVPDECVRDVEFCEETFGECGCFAKSPVCAKEMKLCFRPDEHSC